MADMDTDIDYDYDSSNRDGRTAADADTHGDTHADTHAWDPVPPGGLPYDGQPMHDIPLLQQLRPLEASRDYHRSAPQPPKSFDQLEMSGAGGDLMGRLSRHKVYLLEESGALIHRGVDEKLDDDVDLSFLSVASSTSHSPIRDNALHLSGPPLAHLPTAKIFSYVTLFAPKPLGVEWINDTNLVVIFENPQVAFLALTRLSKAGFEPWEGRDDDPLVDRPAQPVPSSLLPVPPPAPRTGDYDDEETADDTPEGLRPGARVDVRYAKMDDMKERKTAAESSFYKRYGRRAGKETAPTTAIARDLEEYSAQYPDLDYVQNYDSREEGGQELLDEQDDDEDGGVGVGFRADQVEHSREDLLAQGPKGRSRVAHMDELEDNLPSSDLLDGPSRTTGRLAMDEVDTSPPRRRLVDRMNFQRQEDEFGREARPRRLVDRLNIKNRGQRDERELSPVRQGSSGMRGWDEEVTPRPDRSLLDRLGGDERLPKNERDWDRQGQAAERREYRETRESRYEPRGERRGRRGGAGAGGGRSGEKREQKNASDLDRELDEFLGRA